MHFVICAYGNHYVPMLMVCLDSINREHPEDRVTVLWDQISKIEVKLLQFRYPSIVFQQQEYNIPRNNLNKRIPLKLRFWANISKNSPEEIICFLDCDTLIYKNINRYAREDYDFLFTWKNERWPLNVGVVIVKNTPKITEFVELWRQRTEVIIENGKLLKTACNNNGAADQQALVDLMKTSNYNKDFQRTFDFGTIHFKGVLCKELNQTNSVPMNDDAHIYHYKGGWHPILLQEKDYSTNRPKHTSLEMRIFWENRYADLNESLMKDTIIAASSKHENSLDWSKIEYEERGILHSEMLAITSVLAEMKAGIIIETGRCRGQSTKILAERFKNDNVSIISIELAHDENAEFAEEQLREYPNVKLLYGDANKLLPVVIKENSSAMIAILFDGPKGIPAFKLFSDVISKYDNVIAGFFHDCRKPYRRMNNCSRNELYSYYDRYFFTDDLDYVSRFQHLDDGCNARIDQITEHSWRPYLKGWQSIGSYGPTIGVVIPTERDRERWRKTKKAKWGVGHDPLLLLRRIWRRLRKGF